MDGTGLAAGASGGHWHGQFAATQGMDLENKSFSYSVTLPNGPKDYPYRKAIAGIDAYKQDNAAFTLEKFNP